MQMLARNDKDFVNNLKMFDCSAMHYSVLLKRRGLCYEIHNYHNQNMLLYID